MDELIVWHRQYGIRGMQIAEPWVDKWLPTIAVLNLKLKNITRTYLAITYCSA